MNKIIKHLVLGVGVFASSLVYGQQENTSGFDVGFHLNEQSNDFGLGINISSPRIFKESVQIRLRTNVNYLEYFNGKETAWEPYHSLLLGVSSATAKIHESIGLYGEGGAALILPSEKISDDLSFGSYGIFGFEFYFYDGFTYFLEAGAMGSEANAEKLISKPIIANGFLMAVGLKIKL